MAKKYYAVKVGKAPGIYLDWDSCKANVDGVPGAKYKSFATIEEAEAFVRGEEVKTEQPLPASGEAFAYVDGSFDVRWPDKYGYGVVFITNEGITKMNGSETDADNAQMRNVAGEVLGAMTAIKRAEELHIKKLVIYYDYEGIASWALGKWKTNKEGTKRYKEFFDSKCDLVDISFVKVKGHSGVQYNEMADTLAKKSLGIM